MKYLIYLSVTLLFSTSVFSQDSTQTLKPVAGDRVLSIGLINNSAFWAAKKYKTDTKACRIGLIGSLSLNPETSNTSSNAAFNQTSTTKSSSSAFSLGMYMGAQKSFGNLKRVEPYVGLDFGLSYSNSSRTTKVTNTDINGTTSTENKTTNPYRVSLTALPLVGFNYYIAPRLAIGAEYRLTIASFNYEFGGFSKTTQQVNNSSQTIQESKQDNGAFSFNSNLTGNAFITATIFFH